MAKSYGIKTGKENKPTAPREWENGYIFEVWFKNKPSKKQQQLLDEQFSKYFKEDKKIKEFIRIRNSLWNIKT